MRNTNTIRSRGHKFGVYYSDDGVGKGTNVYWIYGKLWLIYDDQMIELDKELGKNVDDICTCTTQAHQYYRKLMGDEV